MIETQGMAHRHACPFHELGIEPAQQSVLISSIAKIQCAIPALRKHLRGDPCFRLHLAQFAAIRRTPDNTAQIIAPVTQEISESVVVQY